MSRASDLLASIGKKNIDEAMQPGTIEFKNKEGLFIKSSDGKISVEIDIPRSALAGLADGGNIGKVTFPMSYEIK